MAENFKNKKTYISLFSSAGVGCYGFKETGFECVATNELLAKRLKIQEYNRKCKYETGYIEGDIQNPEIKAKIFQEIERWENEEKIKEIDVVIATPPCQGMSVANHKKKDEQNRNSLIVQSIDLVKKIQPRYFVFENVKTFLSTTCTNIDGKNMPISDAIDINLENNYNILKKVVNFKDYGANSSRTRTLVIGVRKDIIDITPYDLFPKKQNPKNLIEIIGHYDSLKKMGEISKGDIYHSFRAYDKQMYNWIKDIKEGESAFDNVDPRKKPHRIIDGKIIINTNKNGDKYKRCEWNKVAPCIHTRNDILASQSTIHPVDNRVFSVRELMSLMTIPFDFKWSDIPFEKLCKLPLVEKRKFLKQNELNIRQSIGEAVPTIIFKKIAQNILDVEKNLWDMAQINYEIDKYDLTNIANLKKYIKRHKSLTPNLFKIAELVNAKRVQTSAYYTRRDICYTLVNELPDFMNQKVLNILEPSAGIGNFIFLLLQKYSHIEKVNIDIIDIDANALEISKLLLSKISIPNNFNLKFIQADFLLHNCDNKYDIVIGNPPFGKVNNKLLLKTYKNNAYNNKTGNIFAFFIEKCINISNYVALITPKSLLSTPEFNLTRDLLSSKRFITIYDYGEQAFKGVKIETISFILEAAPLGNNNIVSIKSYITQNTDFKLQTQIFDKKFPFWIIYRNKFFDDICKKLILNVFDSYRDRQITKKFTKNSGKIRVLKSRNIQNNEIISIQGYDSYIDCIEEFTSKKYLNTPHCILVPNLSYYPRACFKPANTLADGSVAILSPKINVDIDESDLSYFSTDEFTKFYKITRNYGTRSLNIDSNAVYFWGIRKKTNVR